MSTGFWIVTVLVVLTASAKPIKDEETKMPEELDGNPGLEEWKAHEVMKMKRRFVPTCFPMIFFPLSRTTWTKASSTRSSRVIHPPWRSSVGY